MERRKLLGAAALAVPVIAGGALFSGTAEAATTTTASTVVKNAAPPVVGVQFHGTWDIYWSGTSPNATFTKHLDTLAAQGVQVIRMDVGWSSGQPTNIAPDASQWYHQRISTVIDAVRARGMQIFLTVHQSPAWARPNTGSEVKQYPTDPNAIKPWLTFLAATYEPNLSDFTQIGDAAVRATRYVAVLKAAYTAIKAGRPSLPVIHAGPSQTDSDFIAATYAAGSKGSFDIMGVHPYQGNQTKPPEATDITGKARMTNMPAIIALMAKYGDAAKPIWWTEFGFSVHANDAVPAGQVWLYGLPDDATAGDYLVRAYNLAWQQWPQVKLAVTYCSYRTPSDALGHQYGYRVLEADGTAKAQLKALAALRRLHGPAQKL
jgi:hypothetical protein